MEALPGVINVSLIYHHVESHEVMDEIVSSDASLQGAGV
jgi:nitrate reductase NapD